MYKYLLETLDCLALSFRSLEDILSFVTTIWSSWSKAFVVVTTAMGREYIRGVYSDWDSLVRCSVLDSLH